MRKVLRAAWERRLAWLAVNFAQDFARGAFARGQRAVHRGMVAVRHRRLAGEEQGPGDGLGQRVLAADTAHGHVAVGPSGERVVLPVVHAPGLQAGLWALDRKSVV